MKLLLRFCLVVIIFIFLTETPMASAENANDLKNKINQDIENREKTLDDLQDKKADLNGIEGQQANITQKVQELESQIEEYNNKIQVKQDGIDKKQKEVQSLKKHIKSLQDQMKKRKEYIAKRMRATYKQSGTHQYLKLLLDSEDFGDFVSRIYFISQIEKHDRAILDEQMDDKKKLEKNQDELKNTLNKLNGDLQNLKNLKSTLDSKKASQQAYLTRLKEKGNEIQTTIKSKQQQVAYYKKQEEIHRAELKEWERKLLSNSNIPKEIQQFVDPAQQLDKSTGIPAAITIAQIILESGGQLSTLATEAKNLFGIKGQGPAGTYIIDTNEVVNGNTITVKAGFKKYDTYYQSMVDHAKTLQLSRYQNYLRNAHSLEDYAYGIQSGGYSTDPTYASKILTIIKDYGLAKYDSGSF
ncbi:flagellum-specific peptidoglycan hydrolase FlgJ [Pullulanibacillus pueri]|uniref:Mannosyl-glycoprotein endo-beta-N-acetylglucosamidase-like domain-containing protein n=1 Tax=Pullulanibacillus pueri TaxID=1437324 RepID=A0A8J2ZZ86_9BACL|nr:glucosaminidase domain-containing protein [Pullulanibacillus pueri]MBM7680989.1 flagellum-specific peptidoglycan hydrolase FlgJ [Pullulanibacillus pueri]GGH86232.1 hypothetical protein GCM10007096_33460 [Pullulanibacillus pueri]